MTDSNIGGRGTVTHFSKWVFDKENPTYARSEYKSEIQDRQELGRFLHTHIQATRGWIQHIGAGKGLSSNWELVYADDESDRRIFTASCLLVDGKPVRGKPDVVLRDKETGTIIIIERKTTGRGEDRIPIYSWPNVWVQLWCYGFMDEWADAPDVVLACQYWKRNIENMRQLTDGAWLWNWKARPGWKRSAVQFHLECLNYFLEYGGQFIAY